MESHNPAMFQSAPNRYLNNAIQDWYEHQFNEVQSASCWGFFHNMDEGFPATKRLTEQSSWAQEQRGLKSLNTELEIEYWVKKSGSNGIIATWNIMKHHETHHPWAEVYTTTWIIYTIHGWYEDYIYPVLPSSPTFLSSTLRDPSELISSKSFRWYCRSRCR
jgi:hypothetical protein